MNYLTGKQIELRAVEPEDLDALYRWENDSSLWIYGSTVSPFSRYLLKQYIENYTADITRDKQLRLIIMRKESRQVIGAIDCFDYGHTRQGFGRDALETFVEYAFRFLHLHQLYVHIPVCNTASIALFRTCGFHESTRLKDWIRLPQGYADALIFQKFNRE